MENALQKVKDNGHELSQFIEKTDDISIATCTKKGCKCNVIIESRTGEEKYVGSALTHKCCNWTSISKIKKQEINHKKILKGYNQATKA